MPSYVSDLAWANLKELALGYYQLITMAVQYLKLPMHLAHCVYMLCCPLQHVYIYVTFVASMLMAMLELSS